MSSTILTIHMEPDVARRAVLALVEAHDMWTYRGNPAIADALRVAADDIQVAFMVADRDRERQPVEPVFGQHGYMSAPDHEKGQRLMYDDPIVAAHMPPNVPAEKGDDPPFGDEATAYMERRRQQFDLGSEV